jgi:hypothetical protein
MKRRIALAVLLLLIAFGAWFVLAPGSGLINVADIETARQEFNSAAGSVRVIALLSPT